MYRPQQPYRSSSLGTMRRRVPSRTRTGASSLSSLSRLPSSSVSGTTLPSSRGVQYRPMQRPPTRRASSLSGLGTRPRRSSPVSGLGMRPRRRSPVSGLGRRPRRRSPASGLGMRPRRRSPVSGLGMRPRRRSMSSLGSWPSSSLGRRRVRSSVLGRQPTSAGVSPMRRSRSLPGVKRTPFPRSPSYPSRTSLGQPRRASRSRSPQYNIPPRSPLSRPSPLSRQGISGRRSSSEF